MGSRSASLQNRYTKTPLEMSRPVYQEEALIQSVFESSTENSVQHGFHLPKASVFLK
ncbi:hypothetical protein MNBD_NITROSPIRAE01-168 [hydrothermal vent metagenome]|uniref:Uncharacterized protein n=1 Tax=hydrothermal vent metagenome TaxID=652676 RepID=A0A3B1CSW5_9ZZZZ